ncbi:putative ATPase [Bacillus sp. TS-2]|nr:putative ATPase [Bacillus sp. TS-2]
MRTIFFKVAEKNLLDIFLSMKYTEEDFIRFQKRRMRKFIFFMAFGVIMAIVTSPVLLFFGLGAAVYQWSQEYKQVKVSFKQFNFMKQLTYGKFTRNLIPELKKPHATIYTIFNRMLPKIEDGHVKNCLERLIINMNENPNSDEPFKEFAEDASGTDDAHLFFSTLYDYQQYTFDDSVLYELGQMASEDLFNSVDEIILYKISKFKMNPTKVTMLFLVLLGAYSIAFGYDLITNFTNRL